MELKEKQERYNVLVSRIVTNKGVTTSAIYQIGLDLKEIQERELYLLDCRDFKEFLRTRIDMERSTAYLAIEMVKTYSITEFNKWGLTKLLLIKRQLPEEEDRKEFIKTHTVKPVESIRHDVIDYRVSRGIKAITRFTDQIPTKPDLDTIEEGKLRLKRQWAVIKEHCESLISVLKDELVTWITQAKKFETDKELAELIDKAEKQYKRLQ